MADSKRILVAPLDWGLGHATRCIPIIEELKQLGAEVLIGTSGKALALLKQEFPELPTIEMPSYRVDYPKNGNMGVHMVRLAPRIAKAVQKEHRALDRAIKEHGIQAVISDNRLGLWNKRIPTVLITHQLYIQTPRFRWAVDRLNRRYLSRFDRCWIPDVEDLHENLSGALSHGKDQPRKVRFIGPLSRFHAGNGESSDESGPRRKGPVLGLISGPEPQRGMLADSLNEELKSLDLEATLITGNPEKGKSKKESPRIREYPHLPANELQKTIEEAGTIVTRSGYSTIMDLASLGRKAVMIPTPGQTEQEYLAEYHDRKKHFLAVKQDHFELKPAIEKLDEYQGIQLPPDRELLRGALREIL